MSKVKVNPLQKSNDERHILGLIRKHGLSGARRALLEEGRKAPSLPTLSNLAKVAKIEVPGRGRPPVYAGKDKDRIVALIRKYGSHKLAGEELKAKGLAVPTLPMMVHYAQEAGVSVKRGRPAKVAVAAA